MRVVPPPGAATAPSPTPRAPWHRRPATRETIAGWLFVAPVVVVFLIFFVAPIAMALWVSLLDWNGQSNPLTDFDYVGLANYRRLLTEDTLLREDFGTSIRNTVYYVLVFVPAASALAFGLALVVNNRALKGRSFYRSAFYFPSITSSVAVSVVFLFLFQSTGAVNQILSWFGLRGPTWFTDARGVGHIVAGGLGLVDPRHPPAWLTDHEFLSVTWWEWVAGPSVAMIALLILATWTSSGTFMLFFLAGLQNIPREVEEASAVDGATPWQRFRLITMPLMRRSIVLVTTLALIGSWQVFDQVYIMSQGDPAKTTLTPAYLSYTTSFKDGRFGRGAAIAFVLFVIIMVFSALQRRVTREKA